MTFIFPTSHFKGWFCVSRKFAIIATAKIIYSENNLFCVSTQWYCAAADMSCRIVFFRERLSSERPRQKRRDNVCDQIRRGLIVTVPGRANTLARKLLCKALPSRVRPRFKSGRPRRLLLQNFSPRPIKCEIEIAVGRTRRAHFRRQPDVAGAQMEIDRRPNLSGSRGKSSISLARGRDRRADVGARGAAVNHSPG